MQPLAAARPCARWAQPQCLRAALPQQPRPFLLGPRSLRRQSSATVAATATPDPFFAAAPSAAELELQSFDQMQQAMRQFDRDMDSLFWGPGRSPFAEAEREIESALRRADEVAAQARREAATRTTTASDDGRVRVERSETRAPGTYRYYERIEINGGGWVPAPTVAAASAPPPLLLLVALIAAGAYAALTAAFARNFDLTLYAARDKLRLALTWPLLLLTSRSFRAQFVSAVVKGEKVRVTRPSGGVSLEGGGVLEGGEDGKGVEDGRRQGA